MTSAFEVFHVGSTERSFAAPIDEPATAMLKSSHRAGGGAHRRGRPVTCSGDGASFGTGSMSIG